MAGDHAAGIAARIRLNALVDRGWLAVLGRVQLGVWMTYNARADPHGTADPSAAELATLTGCWAPEYVRTVRGRLCKLGLLLLVKPARAHYPPAFLVLVPPERVATNIETGVDLGR